MFASLAVMNHEHERDDDVISPRHGGGRAATPKAGGATKAPLIPVR